MPDLVIRVHIDPNTATFSYEQVSASPGWHAERDGSIHPPSGSGTGVLEFQLAASEPPCEFAGFNVSRSDAALPEPSWGSEVHLSDLNLTPTSPSPWPTDDDYAPGPLLLNFQYGQVPLAEGAYTRYQLKAVCGTQVLTDEPRIYNDPVT